MGSRDRSGWRRPLTVLAVAVISGAVALTGCTSHDRDAGDTGDTASTAESSAAATPEAPAPSAAAAPADSLPSGFPADIPVVAGSIEGDSMEVPGANGGKIWTLRVTQVEADAYDAAEALLTGAGFTKDDGDHPVTTCERESSFTKENTDGGAYVARLCSSRPVTGYQIKYDINVYPASVWVPGLSEPPSPPK